MNAKELIEKLQGTEGTLSVNKGVLWFENGQSVDLSTVAVQLEQKRKFELDEPVSVPPWEITVFVGASTTAEFGEGPSFAKFTVNDRFIAQLRRLKALCEEQGLTEVRVTAGPDLWGGCDENALRLQCPELVVTCGSFWFNDQPKNMDYEIQTRGQSIDSFIEMVTEDGPHERFIDGIEEEVAAQHAGGILDEDEDDDPMPSGHRDISDNDPGPVRNNASPS
jgi:hypothetical protein